jgi:hypothetical protein
MQPQRAFEGKEKPPHQSMMTTYEFVDEFCKDEEGNDMEDKPRWLSEDFALYNLDSDLAKSTKRYYALDPECEKDGDWAGLVGTPCIISVTQTERKGRVFNNIGGISTMRSKQAENCPELVNPPKVFLIDEPDLEVFKSLPQWIQDKITKDNLEFKGSALDIALNGEAKAEEPTPEEPKDVNEPAQGETEW